MPLREDILVEWNPWWDGEFEFEFVEREVWNRIEKWVDRKNIVALTGCRRSGKTTLMYIAIKKLLEENSPEQILFIKCDDERVEEPIIENALEKHAELFNLEKKVYLFLDEVQNAKDWEKTVKRIFDLDQDIKIFLSGSRLLRKEISSSLAGRCAYFSVYPFNFSEFLSSKGLEIEGKIEAVSKKDQIMYYLREYLEWGGFPEISLEDDKEMKRELLGFYSDTILYRDVIERSGIKKVDKMEKIKSYLIANLSNPINYTKLARRLSISSDTVSSYIKEMENAYFVFPIPYFSYSLKKQQINPKKIYCVDNGLRNYAGFRFSEDIGRLYENVVFLDLKRSGKEVYYWKDEKGRETDFITKHGKEIDQAIQVCYDVEEAGDRERNGLVSTLKKFDLKEGIIITRDYEKTEKIDEKKIKYIPLWKWLMNK